MSASAATTTDAKAKTPVRWAMKLCLSGLLKIDVLLE